jgi:hypothetical protein
MTVDSLHVFPKRAPGLHLQRNGLRGFDGLQRSWLLSYHHSLRKFARKLYKVLFYLFFHRMRPSAVCNELCFDPDEIH